MAKTYYEELSGELDAVLSNEPLMAALDKRLPNESIPTDYDGWIESSIEFLRSNKNLFVTQI